jgi:DNA polymerase (family X)
MKAERSLKTEARAPTGSEPRLLSNAEIAHQLTILAQLLTAEGANPYKVKAYRRAAESIKTLAESIAELVQRDEDLTRYSGIGAGISSAIREIVLTGSLRRVDTLRSTVSPELAALSEHPRLDPKRVARAYKKLGISTIAELRENLQNGELGAKLGARMEQHVRHALTDAHQMLLYDVDETAAAIEKFLVGKCAVKRAHLTGEVRRRVEVIAEISFLVETDDFASVVTKLGKYGGHTERVSANDQRATFKLSSGVLLTVEHGAPKKWGVALIAATGSEAHVEKLAAHGIEKLAGSRDRFATETAAYRKLGLRFIPPELRKGNDEVDRAAAGTLPTLVSIEDIRGELHAHTIASDGAHSIEQMAAAARQRGYEYLGITDHSQSLKIAGGVSEEDLWKQIRFIDKLNERATGIRILKSAEVDILADGSLDYPDELLRELDYTVCSIHSRFGLGKDAQTQRILRAMDNPYFSILGHATGRLLLRRPGYEIEIDRVIEHARQRGCFFEINSSPDRLDLSAENARRARDAGLKIAICTDAHGIPEFDFIRCGIDQARRAGLEKSSVLNCMHWPQLQRILKPGRRI